MYDPMILFQPVDDNSDKRTVSLETDNQSVEWSQELIEAIKALPGVASAVLEGWLLWVTKGSDAEWDVVRRQIASTVCRHNGWESSGVSVADMGNQYI